MISLKGTLIVVAILIFTGEGGLLAYYHNKAREQKADIQQLQQAQKAAAVIFEKQLAAARQVNHISQRVEDERQQAQQQSQTRVVYIQSAISKERCSTQPVPDAVVDRLRAHADKIRQHSSTSAAGKLAD